MFFHRQLPPADALPKACRPLAQKYEADSQVLAEHQGESGLVEGQDAIDLAANADRELMLRALRDKKDPTGVGQPNESARLHLVGAHRQAAAAAEQVASETALALSKSLYEHRDEVLTMARAALDPAAAAYATAVDQMLEARNAYTLAVSTLSWAGRIGDGRDVPNWGSDPSARFDSEFATLSEEHAIKMLRDDAQRHLRVERELAERERFDRENARADAANKAEADDLRARIAARS